MRLNETLTHSEHVTSSMVAGTPPVSETAGGVGLDDWTSILTIGDGPHLLLVSLVEPIFCSIFNILFC